AHITIYVVPFRIAIYRIKVSFGHEIQKLSIGAKGWLTAVVPRIRNGNGAFRIDMVKMDNGELTGFSGQGISNPLAVRPEGIGIDGPFIGMDDQLLGARLYIDPIKILVAVGIKQALTVRAPDGVEFVRTAAVG